MKKDRRICEPINELKKRYTAKIDEVCIKNYLPVCKDMEQYKLWCKRATERIIGDEVNPY